MIWTSCEKNCKAGPNQYVVDGDLRAFEFIRKEGEAGEGLVFAECGNCGSIDCFLEEDWVELNKAQDRRACRRKANLTRYPRFEPHTGLVVKSREHEMEVVKHAGYHVAEHGLDERHNDELADRLKQKRDRMESRRREIRKKREALIREGVIKAPKKEKRS